jgi:hypothetical protein
VLHTAQPLIPLAPASQLGAAGLGAAKGVQVAALGWKSHLIAGGVARGVAVGTLFPVDSVKTKMQVGKPVSFKISDIGHEHFKGFRAAILGQIPYGMLVFGTYETLKAKIFARNHDAPKIPVYVGCAMAGDVVGSVWLTPSEIIKQRLQSGVDRDAVSAARAIYAQRGLGGFYAGFSGLVARDLPYRALQVLPQIPAPAPFSAGLAVAAVAVVAVVVVVVVVVAIVLPFCGGCR